MFPAAGGEIVDDEDLVPAIEHELGGMRAHLAQAARDKCLHLDHPFFLEIGVLIDYRAIVGRLVMKRLVPKF